MSDSVDIVAEWRRMTVLAGGERNRRSSKTLFHLTFLDKITRDSIQPDRLSLHRESFIVHTLWLEACSLSSEEVQHAEELGEHLVVFPALPEKRHCFAGSQIARFVRLTRRRG